MSVDQLTAARDAYDRRAWSVVRDLLTEADPATLEAAELRLLSTAAYLLGDTDAAIETLQRAHTLGVAAGDRPGAARDAHWIAMHHASRGEQAVAAGWVARAQRLLVDEPDDIAERGLLLIHEVFGHLGAGDVGAVLRCCERIREIGIASGEPDLVAFGLTGTGRALIYTGRVPEGLARLDEGMVALTTGEGSPVMAGQLYCTMIEGCQEIGDYRRMVAWTDELTRWCHDQPDLVPYTAQCAVHRAQIMRAHGDFPEALEELERAVERYTSAGLTPAVGLAFYERGEVLRLTGELDDADRAFDQADDHGQEPQPGRSLLWLDRGRVPAALGCAHRLLSEAQGAVARSRMLGPAVEILLAAGETDAAGEAAAELERIAADFGCQSLVATAAHAAGQVALAREDPQAALTHLRRAWRSWIEIGARFDAARARTEIARAMRALGDDVSATSELNVALRTFTELGATPARRLVEHLLGTALPDGLTAREVEVLRLVASGLSNPQIAHDLVLSEKTVARHLSNIFAKTRVTSRTGAAAYAFEHSLA